MHFTSVVPGPPQSWVEIWYGDDRIGAPTPLISWDREFIESGDGDKILATRVITMNGTWINSPSGTYNAVYAAQEQLLEIFNTDGKEFTLRAGPANTVIAPGEYIASGMFPRVRSISLPEDLQYQRFDYTVVLEFDEPDIGGSGLIESESNSWTYNEVSEEQTVRIEHTISIVGRNTAISGATNNAYINAKEYGRTLMGLVNAPVDFPVHVDQSESPLYEISTQRTESTDPTAGRYDASEAFIVSSGIYPWNHSRSISVSTDRNEITTIQLQGKVQGLGRTNIGPSGNIGFDNAVSGWLNQIEPNLFADAAAFYAGLGFDLSVNNKVVAKSVTESEFLGSVDYSVSYTNDPADDLPSGISERSVSYDRRDPVELLARFVIPFRQLGSIVQEMGTPLDGSININARARAINTGDEVADVNRAIAQVESDLNAVKPDPNSAEFIRLDLVTQPSLTYDVITRTATAGIQYAFILDLAGVNSASGSIAFPRYQGGL